MSTTSHTIPAEFEPAIREAIASGRYRSEEDILTAALRIWREREERLDALRAELQIGIDQLDRGEAIAGEVVLQRLRDKAARLKEQES